MDNRISKKVVIDASRGGDDIGNVGNGLVEKDFNLEISMKIYDRLKELGIDVSITRVDDSTIDTNSRVNKIKSFYGNGNDVIVISNALMNGESGASIVYALRNSSGLASKIASFFDEAGLKFNKYYQRRLPSNTSLDYNQIIRDTADNESVIIYYGNTDNSDDATNLINNSDLFVDAVVSAILSYLGIDYSIFFDNSYKVVSGDSLYSIGRRFNVSVDELKKINNLSSNLLSIGQVLKIPSNNNDSGYKSYKVVSGDSLYSIGRKFNISVDELKSFNNLSNNLLSIGQVLKIPSNNNDSGYKSYKVVSGDSLYSIGRKFNVSVDELKSFNNLSSNFLSIGQVLKIPS